MSSGSVPRKGSVGGGSGGRLSGFSDEQSRAILAELAKLRAELSPQPDRVLDRRRTGTIRPRPGDVVRANADDVVVLPHPRSAKGRAPVVVLVEGQPVDVLAESGTVNDAARVTVTTLGAMEWFSTGTEWWGTAVGGSSGGGAVNELTVQDDGVSQGVAGTLNFAGGLQATVAAGVATIDMVGDRHDVTLNAGTSDPYLLPANFRSGDTLAVSLNGSHTINRILQSDGTEPFEGFWFYLALVNLVPPGTYTLSLADFDGAAGQIRTPGHPFEDPETAGDSYLMASEEEGIILVGATAGALYSWRVAAGTAAQALTGAVTASGGLGGPRATLFGSGASGAGLTGGGTAVLAVGAGTGVTVNANDVAVNQATSWTWTGAHNFGHVFRGTGINSQLTVAADLTNLAIGNVSMLRIVTTGGAPPYQLTSMVAVGEGHFVWIQNADSVDSLVILHDDGATGTAANRFVCPNNVNFTLLPRSAVWARYDATTARWFLAARV